MHRDGEIRALYAVGVAPIRVLGSVGVLALVVALITAVVSIWGRPWAYRESYRIEAEAAASYDLRKIATGRFVTLGSKDFTTVIADSLDLENGRHGGVFLHRNRPDDKARSEIIVAEAAELFTLNPSQAVAARFFDGYQYSFDNRDHRDFTLRFGEMTVNIPFDEVRAKYRRKAEPTASLEGSRQPKDLAEYQWRLSTPLTTLLLSLAAVPLARSRPRESRFRNTVLAISLYVGVFGVAAIARTWVEQGKIGAMPGLWIVHVLLVVLLVVLLKRRV
jgi:lipopolysaccharide export system permease protein